MQFENVISQFVSRLIGRLMRRAVTMAALALLVLVAIYHLTIAGTLALEGLYGPLHARLIVVGVYAAFAVAVFIYLMASRAKEPILKSRSKPSGRAPQDVEIAMLLESILLGYTTGRRKSRHS